MYVKQFSFLLLVAVICVALADINFAEDIEVKSEVQNDSSDVFHVGKTCAADSDCLNSGSCESRSGDKFCKCRSGTSGDFCEKVDECVDNPTKCGTLDDVSCVYDARKEKAVCKCENETKTYVEWRCRSPCLNDYICGEHGYCEHKVGNQMFCKCDLGTSGDYCDIIDQCYNKTVDCGVDNNATCTLGFFGKAVCKCDDATKGFDYDDKICKGCEGCGENVSGVGRCVYRDGLRICTCKLGHYSSENGTCENCQCGKDAYGCKFENGTKICRCWPGMASKDGLCQKCDCGGGVGVSKCEFKGGKKLCTCKDGYTLGGSNFPCKQMCNATNTCENGGKCVQNVCKCPKGTSGDLCKTVDDCKGWRMCGIAKCLYNVTSQKAYCKCDGSLAFDDYYQTCEECNCGSFARNCEYVNGKKRCICLDAYVDRLGKCEEIDKCRNSNPCPLLSTNCVNKLEGKYECHCKDGYESRYTFGGTIERDGCQDINECERDYKPCNDNDAKCVNTQGSYKCECKHGYIYRATEEKRNVCHVGSSGARPWRTASIIVGVTSAVVIIGLLITVLTKHNS